MGAEKLRKEIYESLKGLDEKYLRVVHHLIRSIKEEESDWWKELDEETKKEVKLAQQQIAEGKAISHENVMRDVREKYNNK